MCSVCMDSLVVATSTSGLQGLEPTSFIAFRRYWYCVRVLRPVNSCCVLYPLCVCVCVYVCVRVCMYVCARVCMHL